MLRYMKTKTHTKQNTKTNKAKQSIAPRVKQTKQNRKVIKEKTNKR